MKLSDFIEETLYEIAVGVKAARLRARDLVAITPSRLNGTGIDEKSYVDFDVSIVVSEADASKRGAGGRLGGDIQVAAIAKVSLGAGGSAETSSDSRSEQTHRVSFKVPVYLHANYFGNPATAQEAEEFLNSRAASGGP
ncbi:MAG TPA: hypothetical protein VHZ26_04790 [Caulobacteraceae bacterium]|jgi:hypothetical protein|nr:hypothetical protein [Caulobacteraceae bacterium]